MPLILNSDFHFKTEGVTFEEHNELVYETIVNHYDKSCLDSLEKIKNEIKFLKEKGVEIGISAKIP